MLEKVCFFAHNIIINISLIRQFYGERCKEPLTNHFLQ